MSTFTPKPPSVLETGPPTIEVRYQCDACGIRDRAIRIRAREKGQALELWFESILQAAISADHHETSPHCRATSMTWAKVPLGDGDYVGALKTN